MKKIFTLLAVASMAFTASAQEEEALWLDFASALQTQAGPYTAPAAYSADGTAVTVDMCDALQYNDLGVTMALVKEDKTYGGGNTNGELGKPIKFSNGAPNVLVLPDGFTASKMEVYGYCNNADNTAWISTVGMLNADGSYDEIYAGTGEGATLPNIDKADWSGYTFADMPKITCEFSKTATGQIWFKNGGKQPAMYLKIYKGTVESGIASIIADADAPVLYYNLQGQQVANPANGLYIKKQGNTVTKVLVK